MASRALAATGLYFSLAHGEVNFASRWLGLGNTPNPGSNSIPNLLNVDDTDLLANQPVSKNIDVPTTSSFQVIRARVGSFIDWLEHGFDETTC